MSSRRAVLLDRDGTIIAEKNYLGSAEGVELLPGAAQALRSLRDAGFLLIVISNQSGIGRGMFTLAALTEVNDELQRQLRGAEVQIDSFYFCPHAPEDSCECRKPKPLLAQQAARDFGFDPGEAFVIGDKLCDIDLGRAIGARTILVRTGYGRQAEESGVPADVIVDDMTAAASYIVSSLAV